MLSIRHITAALILLVISMTGHAAAQTCDSCQNDCLPKIAIKTNLLHDAVLTPDFGLEIGIARKWSVSLQGVWAWWSKSSRQRFWRIYGGNIEGRFWFGDKARTRALTGHHVGVYGSLHSFDFEFGGTGYQSPGNTYGVGLSYGYSIKASRRINIDFALRAGYSAGRQIKYHYECGIYVCDRRSFHKYFGLTGLEISLVWFPGRNTHNLPDFQ